MSNETIQNEATTSEQPLNLWGKKYIPCDCYRKKYEEKIKKHSVSRYKENNTEYEDLTCPVCGRIECYEIKNQEHQLIFVDDKNPVPCGARDYFDPSEYTFDTLPAVDAALEFLEKGKGFDLYYLEDGETPFDEFSADTEIVGAQGHSHTLEELLQQFNIGDFQACYCVHDKTKSEHATAFVTKVTSNAMLFFCVNCGTAGLYIRDTH